MHASKHEFQLNHKKATQWSNIEIMGVATNLV